MKGWLEGEFSLCVWEGLCVCNSTCSICFFSSPTELAEIAVNTSIFSPRIFPCVFFSASLYFSFSVLKLHLSFRSTRQPQTHASIHRLFVFLPEVWGCLTLKGVTVALFAQSLIFLHFSHSCPMSYRIPFLVIILIPLSLCKLLKLPLFTFHQLPL